MMKKIFSVLWVLFILSIFSFSVYGQPIKIVTENFPPYNYEENGKITGVSTEIVRAVLQELNIKVEIKVYPWARTLMVARHDENTLIYSIGRNQKRENQYKWIGVIAPADFYLFALKNRVDIKIKILADAKKYQIGTVREDLREQYLISKGFIKGKNIQSTNRYLLGFQKLLSKRIDLWSMPELTASYIVKKEGYKPEEIIKKVYRLDEVSSEGYYMAFGKKTSDEIVEKFRSALEKIKKNGTHKMILEKYLK
ncbi:MAG: amino acid ABC transporter substrate-binding protein [Desulfobacteraceae bacterium]|nr:amino acid ABC transporter substrate-binding protein [Desulfobacteraceae bacterium]